MTPALAQALVLKKKIDLTPAQALLVKRKTNLTQGQALLLKKKTALTPAKGLGQAPASFWAGQTVQDFPMMTRMDSYKISRTTHLVRYTICHQPIHLENCI